MGIIELIIIWISGGFQASTGAKSLPEKKKMLSPPCTNY